MKAKHYSLILVLLGILQCAVAKQGQDTLRFDRNMFFDEGHNLEAYAGSVIELGPGVLLLIEGSLCLEGTSERPIRIINKDPEKPGVGIQIQAQNHDASVKIRHVEFENLTQALRFDPFWYRKEIILEDLSFQGSTSGEPVLYLGDPYIDRRWGRSIDLKIHDLLFVNNSGGMVMEAYGSPLVNYDINRIHFRDNLFKGPEQALIHFDLYPDERNPQSIGSLIFDRNHFESDDYLISLGGTFEQELIIDTIAKAGSLGVLDHRVDHRLAQLEVKHQRSLKNNELTDFRVIDHRRDSIQMIIKNIGQKNLNLKVLDAQGSPLRYKMLRQADKTWFIYSEGPAQFVELADGYRIVLPNVTELNPADTAENEIEKEIYAINEEEEEQEDLKDPSRLETLSENVTEFFTANTSPVERWEVGAWGGGGLYGAGDIKPKFAFVEDLVYIPSTIDWSFGAYAQYNFNSRFAAKLNYYNTTISMHDLSTVGFFTGTAPLYGRNEEYELVKIANSSSTAAFLTHINSIEIEGLWHLRSYELRPNQWSKLIPSIGLSVGAFHFTPYRTLYTPQGDDENYFEYLARNRENRYNLRDLGTEGQNFLPGAKPYGSLALSAGLSFSMTWLFQDFALKGEVRSVYTSTDYLDDFGPGLWYGGDANAVKNNHRYDGLSDNEVGLILREIELPKPNTFRSTDGLNDWYFQGHLGFSIFLDKPKNK
jgi:hypothetical protein